MPQIPQNTESAEVRRIVADSGTKSEKARQLAALNVPIGEIARLLSMSPGHAAQAVRVRGSRNTSRRSTAATPTPPNTNSSNTEIRRIVAGSGTKSEKARQLAALNVPIAEIARLLGMSAGHAQQSVRGRGRQGETRSTTPTVANPVQVSAPVPASVAQNRDYTIELSNHQTFNRKFGVEIECFIPYEKLGLRANVSNTTAQEKVKSKCEAFVGFEVDAKRDGSIKNYPPNHFPIEIATKPLKGLEGLKKLKKICDFLDSVNAKVNRTCGLHVHFDAQEFQAMDWRNIIANYAILESDIDSFLAPSRRGNSNIFARAITKNGQPYETLIKAIQASSKKELRDNLKFDDTGRGRYHKVNLYTENHGLNTVEFRQHHGTVEFHKIVGWVLFLDDLVKLSEYKVLTKGGNEALKRFVNPDVMSQIEFRRRNLRGES